MTHPPTVHPDATRLQIRETRYGDADVLVLVEQVQAEYVRRYGGPDETPLATDVFVAPLGAFFVGTADGVPVAMGGWRLRDDVLPFGAALSAEVKRMFSVAAVRRRGYARAMLAHLEATARAAGAQAMVLETGTGQPEAIALYESAGYERIAAFGHYADSPLQRNYGKRL